LLTGVVVMKQVNIHEAKTTLSQLIAEAERGEEVVIARNGVPVVRLVPVTTAMRCEYGAWRRLPGWENFQYDASVFAPVTDQEMADEGWP